MKELQSGKISTKSLRATVLGTSRRTSLRDKSKELVIKILYASLVCHVNYELTDFFGYQP